MPTTLAITRRSLHGVAELLLAGQSYRAAGTIRLTVVPGGFATTQLPGTPRRLTVDGAELVVDHTDHATARLPLRGTFGALADAAGVLCEAPLDVYTDTSGLGAGDAIEVDPDAARLILGAFAVGDRALRAFVDDAPGGADGAPVPVLWPEHFDVAVSLDEVNYGVSAGDSEIPAPYAYVGPWTPREGDFWNVSFGAARTIAELDGDPDALLAFYREGRETARA